MKEQISKIWQKIMAKQLERIEVHIVGGKKLFHIYTFYGDRQTCDKWYFSFKPHVESVSMWQMSKLDQNEWVHQILIKRK